MKELKEIAFCKKLLCGIGRYQKIKLLKYSCLTNRQRNILYLRFVEGLSVKETADKIGVDDSTLAKAQRKALKQLYDWIEKNSTDIRQIISISM